MDIEVELQAGIKILKQQRYALKTENAEQAKQIAGLEAENNNLKSAIIWSGKFDLITVKDIREFLKVISER